MTKQNLTVKNEKQLTRNGLLKAIENSYGNITFIAKKMGCNRLSVYNWLAKDKIIKEAIDLERERIIDLAENKLLLNINDGKETSINFVLRTLGKKRGYVEKYMHEHDVSLKNVNLNSLTDEQLVKLREMVKAGVDIKTALISLGVGL